MSLESLAEASALVQVDLREGDEATATVTAIAVGPFAVFQQMSGWNVTHRSTGYAVVKEACCVFGAIAIAEVITPLIDWAAPYREIELAAHAAGIGKSIRALICPVCERKAL